MTDRQTDRQTDRNRGENKTYPPPRGYVIKGYFVKFLFGV